MRYQHRYGFGGEPVTSRRWGWLAVIASKIVFVFQSIITTTAGYKSWLK